MRACEVDFVSGANVIVQAEVVRPSRFRDIIQANVQSIPIIVPCSLTSYGLDALVHPSV